MIEIVDNGGVRRLLNVEAITEASPAPGSSANSGDTRAVMRNGVEHRISMPYAMFRARLRTLLDRMLPIDREVSP